MISHFDMELTQKQARKYKKGSKKVKGKIISRYCELTGISRNLASKRFCKVIRNPKPRIFKSKKGSGKKRGPKPKYTAVHRKIIKKAWRLSGEICTERLQPILGDYLAQLEQNGKLKHFNKKDLAQSKKISEATLKRVIALFPKTSSQKKKKGRSDLYRVIPIHAWFGKNASRPGYVEIDYVEHSGGNSSGRYAATGCYVDVYSGWITRSASLGKSQKSVGEIHKTNEEKIHHRVYEYHPDNAKPILKLLWEKQQGQKKPGFSISRSRPYHKEDNGHVEQKNGDKVRKLVGYHRYDTEEEIKLLNKLYDIEDLISNFFLPSQKLVKKIKDKKGRVIKKKYDRAKTAYQRLIRSVKVDKKTKNRLTTIYKNLNLIMLRRKSERIKKQLFKITVSRKKNMI